MEQSDEENSVGKRKVVVKKRKRKRTVIAPEEAETLEKAFQKEARPDRFTKLELARDLNKSAMFVSIWFQNRRARERKMDPAARLEKEVNQHSIVQPLDLRRKGSKSIPKEKAGTVLRSPMFHRLVRMAAAAEGGIIQLDCPHLGEAIQDACRGIRLTDGRLHYHPNYGFDIDTHLD